MALSPRENRVQQAVRTPISGEEIAGVAFDDASAWKSYMRRVTTTVNASNELPLSQGVRFETGSRF